jgi:hypothetical protein
MQAGQGLGPEFDCGCALHLNGHCLQGWLFVLGMCQQVAAAPHDCELEGMDVLSNIPRDAELLDE